MANNIKVGITHGDYNGIGYEVILKMLDDERIPELCTPVIYGSAKIAALYRKQLGLQGPAPVQIRQADDANPGQYYIINVIGEDAKVETGHPSAEAGQAAFAALERAVADLREGKIDVLLTAPINKATIQSELFTFPGHTEYLGRGWREGPDDSVQRPPACGAGDNPCTSGESGRSRHQREPHRQDSALQCLSDKGFRYSETPYRRSGAESSLRRRRPDGL